MIRNKLTKRRGSKGKYRKGMRGNEGKEEGNIRGIEER